MSYPAQALPDLIVFDAAYSVIICKVCQYALVPAQVASHLRAKHQKDAGLTTQQVKTIAAQCLTYPAHPPAWIQGRPFAASQPVVPFLRLHQNGFCCKLYPATNAYVCCSGHSIAKHLKDAHQWVRPRGPRGGQPATLPAYRSLATVATFPITCQTFFQQHTLLTARPAVFGAEYRAVRGFCPGELSWGPEQGVPDTAPRIPLGRVRPHFPPFPQPLGPRKLAAPPLAPATASYKIPV